MGQWKYNPFSHKLDYYPEDGDIDHGGLAGLADDDHTQYLLADGSRTLAGNLDIDGNLIFNSGGDIRSTSNGNVRIIPSGTGITQIGDAGSTSHALTANDDLFISGKLEVDGRISFDAVLDAYGGVTIVDNQVLAFGSSVDSHLDWSTAQTTEHTLVWGLGNTARSIIFTTKANVNKDFDHATQENPTILIHSKIDPDIDNTQWMSLTHDRVDGVLDVGTGLIRIGASGNNTSMLITSGLQVDGETFNVDAANNRVGVLTSSPRYPFHVSGTTELAGGLIHHHVKKSGNYTTVDSDYIVGFDTVAASGTITLGTATLDNGRTVVVKDEGGNASANFITIATEGTAKIDGIDTKQIIGDYGALTLYSDKTNWFIE